MPTTDLQIIPMQAQHLPQLQALWQTRYARQVAALTALPAVWGVDPVYVTRFLQAHLDAPGSVVAVQADQIVGYLTCDRFDFHGEPSAFFPIMAHSAAASAQDSGRIHIYQQLYAAMARHLVAQGVLNHFFTFFAHDQTLKTGLFELGFGLYVVDAYRDLSPLTVGPLSAGLQVRPALPADLDALVDLNTEANAFYAGSPLFLKRWDVDREELAQTVADPHGRVFLAFDGQALAGFLNVRRSQETDEMILSDTATGCLDPLGAYIRPGYRGRGIGKALLSQAIEWARAQACTCLHVDYESANLFASQFWPRYFQPALYSVKRRLNSDAG